MKKIQVKLLPYEWDFLKIRTKEEDSKKYFNEIWKKWGWGLIFNKNDKSFWEFYRYRLMIDRNIKRGVIKVDNETFILYEFVGKIYGVSEGNILEYCIRREVTGDSGGGVEGLVA